MGLNEILRSNVTLFIFLALTAILGWVYPYVGKTLGKKYSPLTLGIVDSRVAIMTLTIGVSFSFLGKEKISEVATDLHNMSMTEYAQLIAIGFLGTSAGLAGTAILQHHDIGKFQLHDYIITMIVSAIGIYVFMREQLDVRKIIGLVIIAAGGYIFSN